MSKKPLFPDNVSYEELQDIIRQAYRYGKEIKTQGSMMALVGEYKGMKIKMWLNLDNETIITAYPIG
ncbi:MAG: EndoU domain-containing protein [Simkaniaceae bacterium]|nr:MAG: EndoU domain-containing protein [Simkaniaceae bacterium]